MGTIMWLSIYTFIFLMVIGGVTTFFGSDYAQRKWHPDYQKNKEANK